MPTEWYHWLFPEGEHIHHNYTGWRVCYAIIINMGGHKLPTYIPPYIMHYILVILYCDVELNRLLPAIESGRRAQRAAEPPIGRVLLSLMEQDAIP